MRKIFILTFIAILLGSFLSSRTNAQTDPGLKIDQQVQATLDNLKSGEMTTVIVTLAQQADLSQISGPDRAARQQGIIRALQATAEASQRPINAFLQVRRSQGTAGQQNSFWVFNGLAVTATADVIQELAARSDVAKITPDAISITPTSLLAANAPGPNLSVIHAPDLWNLGFYGQGVVVANMDSGVDASHPDLSSRWRGGSNSWFDPYGQHATPYDPTGHGTWTMGVMVGGDAGGTSIGVAPQAQWIAVKIYNDAGSATATAIHQGYQWLLDPDDNPNTADAPQVVNNSWAYGAPGCNLEFQLDLQALRAVGILPIFAAGNYGPNASTSVSPANYPEAFAVGAVDNADQLYAYSSRGPSACGEAQTTYPELTAPGVSVNTTDRFGLYTQETGTSMSAPHAAGALALLLNAYPNLTDYQQQQALINGAVDLGTSGPDDDFGYGRLDALVSYQWLQAGGSTVTPTPTPIVNLALNKSTTTSSVQDSAHTGAMAVDGDLNTTWQTLRVSGKNKPPTEWITIDLGGSTSLGKVTLEWDAYYATAYAVQVSSDNANWTTVFNTTSGDGGSDTITFNTISARYVRLNTTAWNSGSLRNWLKEVGVYAGSSTPPSPTPPSTPTPTPTPTATPVSSGSMHVGQLAPSAVLNRKNWDATVTITVHDANENLVSGATVSASWSNGVSGSGSCTTDSTGQCAITYKSIKTTVSSVTFTVDAVAQASLTYQPAANHDPSGSSIAVSQP